MSGRVRPVPTGRLALIVVAAAVPVAVLRIDTWLAVAAVVVVAIVVASTDAIRAVSPRSIDVAREFPERLTVGETTQIVWSASSSADRPTEVTVADTMWPSFDASRRRATFIVRPGTVHRFGARITPRRRGRFPLDAISVRTVGPLGLVALHGTRSVPSSLAVMPAHPSRDSMLARRRVPLESGVRSVRTRGTGTEFDQLRDYRPGDDFRRIDWPATARGQHVVVRDYRAERNQNVVVLLDNGRVMAGMIGDTPRVEHAMDAVLGLAGVATSFGDNIGLVTYDSQVRSIVPARNARIQYSRLAEAMYLLDPALDESAHRAAFDIATARFRRRSLFVVFTDLVESVVDESLVPALASLTRSHLVMVAAVRDPDVAGWAAQARHEAPSEVYRSAAAVAALDARERTMAKLRGVGAVVVDARPGELATEVVDRYLELKANGRL